MLLDQLVALGSVILIDLALAADNALAVGIAASGLPDRLRARAIGIGIAAAAGMRIVFAIFTAQLLQVVGLLFAGGLLLLWVGWKLFRELREAGRQEEDLGEAALEGEKLHAPKKTLRQAVTQIILADISMSLDNVLGVAGAAREHLWILVLGLGLSVLLMGVAATFVARLFTRHRWIGFVGVAIIFFVAVKMIVEGAEPLLAFAR